MDERQYALEEVYYYRFRRRRLRQLIGGLAIVILVATLGTL